MSSTPASTPSSSAPPPPSAPISPAPASDLEIQLLELREQNAELQRRRADAEKDRDLFRDLYGKASAHAIEVSRENEELLERATRAEGQVRDGLALLRETHAERVRALEAELHQARGALKLLQGRDARTDDEVRRRAGRAPELEAENADLRERLAELEDDYARMAEVMESMTSQQVEETTQLAAAAAEVPAPHVLEAVAA